MNFNDSRHRRRRLVRPDVTGRSSDSLSYLDHNFLHDQDMADSVALGKRERDDERNNAADEDSDEGPQPQMNVDDDDDEDVGPMPMPETSNGNGQSARKKRKGEPVCALDLL